MDNALMNLQRIFRVYILPGAVFQSVAVAGAYGTGRETVQYFTHFGPKHGLYGLLVSTLIMMLVVAATYEFSRCFKAYDYRTFFKQLIGRYWVLFEIIFIVMFLLILSVIASAASDMLSSSFGVPKTVGLYVMLACIGFLSFYGRELLGKIMTFWSLALYAVLFSYFVFVFGQYQPEITQQLVHGDNQPGWLQAAITYSLYGSVIVPAILYAVRGFETRSEALTSAFISALLCQVPAFLFHISFLAHFPDILQQSVPIYWIINELNVPLLLIFYIVVLFGTFIETGAGFVQSVNERIDRWREDKNKPAVSRWWHAGVAAIGLLSSALLAKIGIITLVAQGYNILAWFFFLIYLIPLFTVGLYKIWRHSTPSL